MIYTLEKIMLMCTIFAKAGVKKNIGGPFGAAIVKPVKNNKYKVVSIARNEVISTNNPTAHAEMNAIQIACKKLNTFDLSGYILVSTGQSCPMCLSAAIWANIDKIIYGTDYLDAEAIGFRDKHIHEHINGKIEAIKEEQQYRDIAIICQKEWRNKIDKINY